MMTAGFFPIIQFFTLARIYSKRPQKCCALFRPKSSPAQRSMHQKAVEWYVKEHLSIKIFTRSCHYRNIDSCQRWMYTLQTFTLKSKWNARLSSTGIMFWLRKTSILYSLCIAFANQTGIWGSGDCKLIADIHNPKKFWVSFRNLKFIYRLFSLNIGLQVKSIGGLIKSELCIHNRNQK